MNFTDFSLDANLLRGIEAAGYVTCTPVQEQVLQVALDGSDLYVQSQTGTGKTAAYLILILQELLSKAENAGKKVLIMVPTRELAVQVEEEALTLNTATGLKSFSFYGGVGYEKQTAALKKGVDVIVGTPGRIIDLHKSKTLDLRDVAFLVIDEADRMFDMGFYPDLREILKFLPAAETRQTMLFSATLNTYVKNLAWEYTRDAKEITIEAENITVDQISQELLHVSSDDKIKLLVGILQKEKPESVIIFCNTKRSCEVVAKRLKLNEIASEFIIGDLPQSRRLQVINDFKAGKISCLVATDVAARGIDVDDLAMVVNFDLPNEAENYVHRIGRTARAGKSGKAFTFCSEHDVYNLPAIERYIEMAIPASVADPAVMADDKSAGIYIKTENWHEDDEREDRHGRGRHGRSRHDREGRDSRGGRFAGAERHGKGDKFAKKERTGKEGEGKFSRERKTVTSITSTKEGIEKLESMSYEERMKFYREKYGGASSAVSTKSAVDTEAGSKEDFHKSKKDGMLEKKPEARKDDKPEIKSEGKPNRYSGGKKKSQRKKNGRTGKRTDKFNPKRNVSASGQANVKDLNKSTSQATPAKKEGFFAKLKKLFGG